MKRTVATVLSAAAAAMFLIADGHAQQPSGQHASTTDPRASLKPGFEDAGQAAKNIQLVAHMGKPQGFFDPSSPAGTATPPETGRGGAAAPAPAAQTAAPAPAPAAQAPAGRGRGGPSGLDFANSDLAFRRADMFVGNFNGFNTYDIETPRRPRLMTSVVCPGGQGDMSVRGNLLFMSVEQTRGRVDCGTGGVEEVASKDRFRGVRVFDISDVTHPRRSRRCRRAAVRTRTRSSTTRRTRPISISTAPAPAPSVPARNSRGVRAGPGRGSEYGALQHRRHQGSRRASGTGRGGESAAHLRGREVRRDRRAAEGRRPRPRRAAGARDKPVP